MYNLNLKDLANILEGAIFFGCGGGGKRANSECFIECIKRIWTYKGTDHITCLDFDEFDFSEPTSIFTMIGYKKHLEKILTSNNNRIDIVLETFRKAYLRANENLGFYEENKIIPLSGETGVYSLLATITLAALSDKNILNGDFGGRAYPSISMCTLTASKVDISPLTMSSFGILDMYVKLYSENKDYIGLESLSKKIIKNEEFQFGKNIYGCIASLFNTNNSSEVKDYTIRNTIITCKDIGEMTAENRLQDIIDALGGYKLFEATNLKFNDINEKAGYFEGCLYLQDNNNNEAHVYFENENFIFTRNNVLHAMAPDLICYIKEFEEAGQIKYIATNNDDLYDDLERDPFNDKLHIIGLKANDILRKPAILDNYYKIDKEILDKYSIKPPQEGYIPIEELNL